MTRRDITDVAAQVQVLAYVREQRRALKEMEDAARPVIELALVGADEGEVDGRVVIRSKEVKTVRLDQKALKEGDPAVHAKYCVPSVSHRLDLVGDDE